MPACPGLVSTIHLDAKDMILSISPVLKRQRQIFWFKPRRSEVAVHKFWFPHAGTLLESKSPTAPLVKTRLAHRNPCNYRMTVS